MKPREARRQHLARQRAIEVRGERLEAVLRNGAPQDKPRPDLVPSEADRVSCLREYRRCVRMAAGEMRGSARHARFLDLAIVELARLIYIDRVLALDPLERAALTPAGLTALSVVDPEEIGRRFRALQGDDGLEGVL